MEVTVWAVFGQCRVMEVQGKIGQCELTSRYYHLILLPNQHHFASPSVGLSQTHHAWWCKEDINRAQDQVLDCERAECREEVVAPMHNLRTVQWTSI